MVSGRVLRGPVPDTTRPVLEIYFIPDTRPEFSFLMSSLKRDCKKVFVWIATHVDYMVLFCPITYVNQINYQIWTFRTFWTLEYVMSQQQER